MKTGATSFKSGFVKDFVDGKAVADKVEALAQDFPGLVTVVTRDYRTAGYDGKETALQGPAALGYLKVGNPDKSGPDKPGVLLTAAPHAREVMQPMIMLEVLQQLLFNYNPESLDPDVKEISALVDETDVHIVPVSNPDGLNFALYDDPGWRKTRCEIPGSAFRGVDCNRNYSYRWLLKDPKENSYGGPRPFSEPETRNVKSIVDENPNIKFICDFHSRGNQIRRPMGVTDEKDLGFFKHIQARLFNAIKSPRGKEFETIESRVVNGASDDYFYFEKGAYALVLESGTEYKPAIPEALAVVKECTEGAKELVRIARAYGSSGR